MRSVVLTREPPRNNELRAALASSCDVHEVPATQTLLLSSTEIAAQFAQLPEVVGTVVVTSARGTEGAVQLLAHLATEVRVIAVGPRTKAALEERGVRVHDVAPDGTAASIAVLPLDVAVVSVGAAEPRPELRLALDAQGLSLFHVASYRTLSRDLSAAEANTLRAADVVVVAAPSAWAVVRPFVADGATVIVPGETTAHEVRASHARVVVQTDPTAIAETVATLSLRP